MKAYKIASAVVALLMSALTVSIGQTCVVPSNLTSNSITAGRATSVWDLESNVNEYNIEIRESGGSWISETTADTTFTFSGLSGCTDYELRVRSVCGGSTSGWHTAVPFKTACSILPGKIAIAAKTASTGNEVIVRWAPMNFSTWKWGNQNGYTVKRITLSANGTPLSNQARFDSETVLDSTLMPIPEWDWKPMADSSDFAGIAAGSIYGDSIEISSFDSIDIIDAFNHYQQDENRFAMSLFAADQEYDVAEAMGIAYKDNSVVAGEEYLYTVTLNNIPATEIYEPGSSLQKTDDVLTLPKPPTIKAMPGDSSVVLAWDKSNINSFFSSYTVEKSSNGGSTFEIVNGLPLIGTDANPGLALFTDTLDNNTTIYKYRVKGVSPFGLIGPYSDVVDVQGVPARVPTNPSVSKAAETSNGDMNVIWSFPANYVNDIQGFHIYRSQYRDKDFQKITTSLLPKTTLNYIDNSPLSTGYYIVKAIDNNNYELESYPQLAQLNDVTPPAAAAGLQCPCDASGKVTLSWERGNEPDLLGYRVFSSTAESGDYVVITPTIIRDSFYVHQLDLNTLSESAFYKVVAFDYRENQSAFSATCIAERPDIIPPSAANITHIQPSTSDVYFEWVPSSSPDVMEHKFQRRILTTNDWGDLLTFPRATVLAFTDTTALNTKTYEYRLLAYDEAGNFSSSIIVEAKPIDNGLRDSIENFTATLIGLGTSPDDHVQLSWDYNKYPDLAGFQVYRAVNYNPMTPYEYLTVNEALDQARGSGQFGFTDNDIHNLPTVRPSTFTITPPGGTPTGSGVLVSNPVSTSNPNSVPANANVIQYQVMAEFTDGATSPFSYIVAVIIPVH